MAVKYLTPEIKQQALELYKAHFTSLETASLLGFSYVTIRTIFRGFEDRGVEKYDRFSLMTDELAREGIYGDAEKQAACQR
uniref:Uncharacterized protein n=1 Tax=viral metagenome TaxID=1070528 RepID=A0A6M3JRE9_9ZZZZ